MRECLECGKSLEGRRADAQYCGKGHQLQGHWRKRIAEFDRARAKRASRRASKRVGEVVKG